MKGTDRPLRRSKQRERILQLLQASESHPTALELYDEIKREFPTASLGNVYRNLNILVDHGQIRRLGAGSTFDRFEHGREAHAHFICTSCGAIADLDLPAMDEYRRQVHETIGGRVHDVRLDLHGLCAQCQSHQNL
jgi:Fur family transcriptional regulator, peroxide stress response regulator